ncbi:regulatory protein RecX [Actinomyces sp. zg-332]|uniref:regulatory protein RecX n=1 Tax=Actinomyces sp. zg-332 TaxID=2708340 RepID=UPI00141FB7A5|nr:regulatory protein RecX [Actinomyces sp. zg-332]QPK93918.1 regulatory protein RecX [Actinomyces sp. zg-332]
MLQENTEFSAKTNSIKYQPFRKTTRHNNPSYEDLCKKAMNVLNYCGRTRAQLFNTLVDYGGEIADVDNLLDELEKTGLINDRQYAEDFLTQAVRIKKIGPKKVKQTLYEKGISAEIISEILEEYSYEEQVSIATEFTVKKLSTLSKQPVLKQKQKITASLINRGFTYNVINDVLPRVLQESSDEYIY